MHDLHVGSFGHIAVWSTMFSKTISTGSCGGVIGTNDPDLFSLIKSHADRGKSFDDPDFNPRDMHLYRFPSLNLSQSEIPCAIGLASLSKIERTINKRILIAMWVREFLSLYKSSASIYIPSPGSRVSYFFLILSYPSHFFPLYKKDFIQLAADLNLPVNPNSRELVSEWIWLKSLSAPSDTPNALAFRNRSIHLLFHERFSLHHVKQVCLALKACEDQILSSNLS